MRITNGMINNTMLLNINRNARRSNDYYVQLASKQKIQLPSDDPIIAARALRFRTNIAETEQYQRNVSQAQSWTEITSQAFSTVTDIIGEIESKLTTGTTGTLTAEDRQKIISDISSLTDQLKLEMNATYAGRYVFSGYRTDEEPTFIKDSDEEYRITQSFSKEDMQNLQYYHKANSSDAASIGEASMIISPYENAENLTEVKVGGLTYTVNTKSISDTTSPYDVGDDEVNFIPETGELVLGANVKNAMKSDDLTVSYDKKGFTKGDLNPKVYFACEDIKTDSDTFGLKYDMEGQNSMEYEIGVGSTITINSLAKDTVTSDMVSTLERFVNSLKSVSLSSEQDIRDKYLGAPHNLTGDALDEAVEEQMKLEESQNSTVTQILFSDMLSSIDDYASSVSIGETNMGSRMSRLELVSTRLANDLLTYEGLKSDNEEADTIEMTIKFNNAEAAYQASLSVAGKLSQMTLIDYIS
ncbi:MAG: flagellar hook-associated protein FlgL [Lachnospirales bacterium]